MLGEKDYMNARAERLLINLVNGAKSQSELRLWSIISVTHENEG